MGFGDEFFGARSAEYYNTQLAHYLLKYEIYNKAKEEKQSGKNSSANASHEVFLEIMYEIDGLLKGIKKYKYELSIQNKLKILADKKLMELCDKLEINYKYLKKRGMAA
ncbi:MAG TPA: hypothetical protein VI564_08955 [Candidatus Nanoarchaeia archaeon]|nr:hypothetical protein [Candidatus Nanoarchaeia archaeon]